MTFPKSMRKVTPIDAKLTVWNPNILLSLIIPAKIKTEFIKFKITTAMLNDLPINKRTIWRIEMIKNNPSVESGKASESSNPLLPEVKFSQLRKPRIIWAESRPNRMNFSCFLVSFF